MGRRQREREREETHNREKGTANGQKDFAGGVVVVEDDMLWGKDREQLVAVVVVDRERAATGIGEVVATASAIRMDGSSRTHVEYNTKQNTHGPLPHTHISRSYKHQ